MWDPRASVGFVTFIYLLSSDRIDDRRLAMDWYYKRLAYMQLYLSTKPRSISWSYIVCSRAWSVSSCYFFFSILVWFVSVFRPDRRSSGVDGLVCTTANYWDEAVQLGERGGVLQHGAHVHSRREGEVRRQGVVCCFFFVKNVCWSNVINTWMVCLLVIHDR